MRYFSLSLKIILITLCLSGSLISQNSAVIVTVDGLDFKRLFTTTAVELFGKSILNEEQLRKFEEIDRKLNLRNNYLGTALEPLLNTYPHVEIHPFEWGGSARYTSDYVEELYQHILFYYNKADQDKKKFIVVSHSWGTVLSYLALSKQTNPIHCDLFITLGSPLGSNNTTRLFNKDLPEYIVTTYVNKWIEKLWVPGTNPNADRWINFWHWGDYFSGPVQNNRPGFVDVEIKHNLHLDVNRNPYTTWQWHKFNSLQPDGLIDNQILIDKVYELIGETISSSTAVNIGFILDSSGSMSSNDPNDTRKTALKVILDQLSGNENIFIIDFDDNASWLNRDNWNNIDKFRLRDQISVINSEGGTNIGAGIEEMKNAFQSCGISGKSGIILLTDGLGIYNGEAMWFSQNQIPVYTISFIGDDNSKLLKEIAEQTNGIYYKANSSSEIVMLFNQFLNTLNGNATLTVYKDNLSLYELIRNRFYVDRAAVLFINLVWPGSKIGLTLHSPDGTTYSYKNPPVGWSDGENYTTVKIDNPAPGKWEAEFYGVDIPNTGEDFIFNVMSDTENKIALNTRTDITGRVNFNLISDVVPITGIAANVKVVTPAQKTEDISHLFSNNTLSYIPRDGKGNYNFTFEINGKSFQRFYTSTILVGDDVNYYSADIKMITGNLLTCQLGTDYGNRVGIKCLIYSEIGPQRELIGEGYVYSVNRDDCLIKVRQQYSERISLGDIVELDIKELSADN